MNLLKRLDQKYLDELERSSEKFPYAIGAIKRELASVNNWSDLTYGTAINLTVFMGVNDYSPTTMNKLFSYEKEQ